MFDSQLCALWAHCTRASAWSSHCSGPGVWAWTEDAAGQKRQRQPRSNQAPSPSCPLLCLGFVFGLFSASASCRSFRPRAGLARRAQAPGRGEARHGSRDHVVGVGLGLHRPGSIVAASFRMTPHQHLVNLGDLSAQKVGHRRAGSRLRWSSIIARGRDGPRLECGTIRTRLIERQQMQERVGVLLAREGRNQFRVRQKLLGRRRRDRRVLVDRVVHGARRMCGDTTTAGTRAPSRSNLNGGACDSNPSGWTIGGIS